MESSTGSGEVSDRGEVTDLLQRWRAGDTVAEARLFELVQPELHRLAQHYMQGERSGHTLQATALLNETYLKLIGIRQLEWRDRRHFYALAARAMRRFLIDHARSRGGGVRLPFDEIAPGIAVEATDLELALSVDTLLDELGRQNADRCSIVELKYFLGLTDEEAAEALDLPLRTAQRRWIEARRWLFERLEGQGWSKNAASGTTSAS